MNKRCLKKVRERYTGNGMVIRTQNLTLFDWYEYRVQSPIFDLTYPPNNVDGAPPGSAKAASDGYWVMLKPLSVGNHTLHLSGGVQNFVEGALNNFETEVTDLINVS